MTSKSVNVPTDTKIKEKDINAKLQLYGIFTAFSNGKAPSNEQIDIAMNSFLEWRGLNKPSDKLSAEGRHLVADFRDVVEKAKILLLTKNQGNLIQDFVWQTQQIGAGDADAVNAPISGETAKQHGNQALEGLRTLGQLVITNGQFRKLLSDATVLLRDIAGDAAQKVASKVNPTDEQLNQIDRPAEDNTWHDAPDFSKDNLKSQVKSSVPFSKKDVNDVAGDATQSAHPTGSRDPNDVANKAANQGDASGIDTQGGLQAGLNSAKAKVNANVDEDTKDQAREYRQRTNDYFKNKVPKDRREQTVYRLKKMLVEIQGHEDYSQAINTLLRLAEEYTGHTKNVAGQTKDAVQGARTQTSLQKAEGDLKTLLERFANSTSFDDLFDSINQIYADADKDPQLKGWFTDLDRFIHRALQEQGYVLQDESDEAWNDLYDRGNFLLRERYRNHTDRIGDELKFLADQFDQDPHNTAFAKAMNKLFLDLGNDENGKATFKPHLVKDLTEVIIPAFFENIRYVPIPRIEYSDPMIDAVVENLVLEGDNLAPNLFEFGNDNLVRWGRKGHDSKNKHKVRILASGIQADLRDVAYYVKKKEGFPGITDKGVADIFLPGNGFSFEAQLETADKSDQHHFFKITKVHVDVRTLNIKLKQSNHKLLFGLFKPLLFKVLRPVIQKAAEKQIRDSITQLDALLYRVKKEADRAAEELANNPDPENAQNIYQRYFNAFQQQLSKAQKKKEEVVDNKTVNVAVTKHDSIFKNISLPGGISTKATEYKELAGKGDKWESAVFSIGDAKASSNIPKATEPVRKPHSVTQGGVRGQQSLEGQGGAAYGSTPTYGSSTNYGTTGTPANYGTTGTPANYGTAGIVPTQGSNTGITGTNTAGYHPPLGQTTGAFQQSSGVSTGASTLDPAVDPALTFNNNPSSTLR